MRAGQVIDIHIRERETTTRVAILEFSPQKSNITKKQYDGEDKGGYFAPKLTWSWMFRFRFGPHEKTRKALKAVVKPVLLKFPPSLLFGG